MSADDTLTIEHGVLSRLHASRTSNGGAVLILSHGPEGRRSSVSIGLLAEHCAQLAAWLPVPSDRPNPP